MTRIDQAAETNRIANSLSTVNLSDSGGRKPSEALQDGIKQFSAGAGSLIPGASMFCSIASAVLGGIAAVFGT